ncbi:MAG: NAD(P)/FAD-dependent oxidoreductase [Shimia sp.]
MDYDVAILGAGAAGLMCAGRAVQAGLKVLVVDHAKAPGEKIRISGGGRCNFTNIHTRPEAFLSENPHFAKSALARYTAQDFVDLVTRHGIPHHEKTLGQLFCDHSAKDIIQMLLREAEGADIRLGTEIISLDPGYRLTLAQEGNRRTISAKAVVLATGGKSIPKMGATGLAYRLAAQFGLAVTETRPALVPLTFPDKRFAPLSGVSLPVRVTTPRIAFEEAMLFTHRGLSGPAILQASSYWREGEEIAVDLLPGTDLGTALTAEGQGKRQVSTALGAHLPARLIEHLAPSLDLKGTLGDLSRKRTEALGAALHGWVLLPGGSEGYRTAEVTLGGIDTKGLNAKTMEAKPSPGLYVIGEAVDVTGWLGGYNFQWAWSSAVACADALASRPWL